MNNNNNNLFQQVVNQNNSTPPAHRMAVTGLVLGIVSLVIFALNHLNPDLALRGSLLLGVVGIVCASIAKKKGNKTNICSSGLVLSIISTALNGAILSACYGCFGCPACALCSGCMAM